MLSAAAILWAVTLNGSLEILGTLRANVVDFSSSATTVPMKTGTSLPGGCTVGQAFFKTDAAAGQNIYLCTAASTWTPVQGSSATFDGKLDARYVVLETDFSNAYNLGSSPGYWAPLGDFVFYRGGSNGMNVSTATANNRIGVARISTAATANDRQRWVAHIAQASSDADSLYGQSNKPWEVEYIFRFPAAADYSNAEFFAGLGSQQTSADPNAGVGVRYASASDSQFVFYASAADNSYGSTLSSGVVPDNAWHKLKIRSDGGTSYRVWVSLDGGTERSVCPSGCDLTLTASSAGAFRAFVFSHKTTEAVAKSLEMDYLRFWMNWGAR